MQSQGPICVDKLFMDATSKCNFDTSREYNLQDFLKLIKSISPAHKHLSYKLSKNLELLALCPTEEEYNMLVEMYTFRFYFGHSVINSVILDKIVTFVDTSRVLEIGAGNGYIAYAMKLSGVQIVATDIPNNIYPCLQILKKKPWVPILNMDNIMALNMYRDLECLMLIWPPIGLSMAYHSLKNFTGSKFIYIGEWRNGQSASPNFFNELDKNWNLVQKIDIPHFIATFDSVYLFTRK